MKTAPPVAPKNEKPPSDPDEALYEMCRKGAVQLDGAADTIAETLQTAKKVKPFASGSATEAMDEVISMIDSAGAGIADYTMPVPVKEEFLATARDQDERRLKAIEVSNDAIRDLKEAGGILDSLAQNAQGTFKKGLVEIDELLDLSLRDMYDAVEALGGKVEE